MSKPINSYIHKRNKLNYKKNKEKTIKKQTKKITKCLRRLPSEVLKLIWSYSDNNTRYLVLSPMFKDFISEYLPINIICIGDSYRDLKITNKYNLMNLICEIPINIITNFMKYGPPSQYNIIFGEEYISLNQYIFRMRLRMTHMNRHRQYFRLSSYSRLLFLIEILSNDALYNNSNLMLLIIHIIHSIKYIHSKFSKK